MSKIDTGLYRCMDCSSHCDACIRGKQSKLPFAQRTAASSRILEGVHVDTVGEMPVTAQRGERYFVVMVDDFSGSCAVHLKSQVPHEVITTLREWERQTGVKVEILRTDRGTEFLNKELTGFCHEEGTVMETSVPYTLEQNGVAERANQSLKEAARTMLVGCNADESLWGASVGTAAYLQNLVPKSGRTNPMGAFEGWASEGWSPSGLGMSGVCQKGEASDDYFCF
jgi:Integrase core domain